MKKIFYFVLLAVMAIGMTSCKGEDVGSNFVTVDGKSYSVKYAYMSTEYEGKHEITTIHLVSCPIEKLEEEDNNNFNYFVMSKYDDGSYSYSFQHTSSSSYVVSYNENCYVAPSVFENTESELILDIKDLGVRYFTTSGIEEPIERQSKMSVHYSGSIQQTTALEW